MGVSVSTADICDLASGNHGSMHPSPLVTVERFTLKNRPWYL
jgi:hypothetical protein